ncbi:MAG: cation:H+ antiporter [Gammaproteobacteria bacterium]|jgi:cation:H+ antiporter
MWISIALGVLGLALLVWGADRFVEGAAATARNLNVSPLLIGMTIVSLGTSAPEALVAAQAAMQGNTALAVGNALGSNITNIALVLGISALAAPIVVRSKIFRTEMPMLVGVCLFAAYLLYDQVLERSDGILLLIGQVVIMCVMFWLSRRGTDDSAAAEFDEEIPSDWSTKKALVWLMIGLACLLTGARLLVDGAITIAEGFGISEVVIGLSIVAIGTSLPELGASLGSALKGEHDIAIGNIIGSNMFNLLLVLGTAGVLGPAAVPEEVITRDVPVMLGLTAAMVIMAFGFKGAGRINRVEAGLLVVCFISYQCWLFLPQAA